jgi:tetratricopeptide (TPR) repeat protein
MKRAALILLLIVTRAILVVASQDGTGVRGGDHFKKGSYKEAISALGAELAKDPRDGNVALNLVRAKAETGDYQGAEKTAREFLASNSSDASVRAALGEILFETGRFQDAAAEFDRAARDGRGAAWLRARFGRLRAAQAQGGEDDARKIAQEFIGYYNTNSPRTAEELTLIARALVYAEKYHEANDLFIDAREADPSYIDAYIGQGELHVEKYNYSDGASLFQDALKINPASVAALVGLARSKQISSITEPLALAERALEVNPNSVRALVLRSWLELEGDDPAEATKAADRALGINPGSIDAMAMRAAIFYLSDKRAELDAEAKRALSINARAGQFYDTLAHFAVNNRRYSDGVDFYRRAIELSPSLWSARTELGMNLLRLGKMAEGRAELERAFKGDPFNLWAKNTLDLLDSMQGFTDTLKDPFLIKTDAKESAVISAYAAELLEEAHKKLTAKYRFTPRSPISVEIFPNHEDFAVRALGLPGLGGALGVCFGPVIAMDSPSARDPGQFNWGGTLWHEYMHVISLQMTDHRIPRWFSEGLSVFEERRARPGWGDDWSLETLKAFTGGRFVKIVDLDSAFLRPKSAEGVMLAYFQASLVCEYVEEKHGFDAILAMLAGYKQGLGTVDILQRSLKLSPAEFDKAFNEYVRAKVAPYAQATASGPAKSESGQAPSKEAMLAMVKANPDDFFAHLRLGHMFKTENNAERAIEHLRRAAELFPYYGGEGNPYWALADLYEARGMKKESIESLETLSRYNETNSAALARLARLRQSVNDPRGAIEALKKSFYIHPFDASLHKLAGDLYLENGNPAEAAREFRVLIALQPPDIAEAHYLLARSLEASGNRVEARREVLRALEIAPGFEKAQELLLKLRSNN